MIAPRSKFHVEIRLMIPCVPKSSASRRAIGRLRDLNLVFAVIGEREDGQKVSVRDQEVGWEHRGVAYRPRRSSSSAASEVALSMELRARQGDRRRVGPAPHGPAISTETIEIIQLFGFVLQNHAAFCIGTDDC